MNNTIKKIINKMLCKDISSMCVDSENIEEYSSCIENSGKNKKYSCALRRMRVVTNRQICEILEPIHEEGFRQFSSRLQSKMHFSYTRDMLSSMLQVLTEADVVVKSSFYGPVDYENGYDNYDFEFIRPISGIQADRAETTLELLKIKDYYGAFHELYEAIDDNGYSHKKWDDKYKSISCNEAILFHTLLLIFANALENELNN